MRRDNMERQARAHHYWLSVGCILVVLKLTGVIAWSWWWVFSPWWIGLGLAIVVFVLAIMMVFVFEKVR